MKSAPHALSGSPTETAQTYRLYVSATSPISTRAIANARRFLDAHLPGRHQLEVLNIAEHLEAARADQVVASPTLIRTAPLPARRFIGDLSDIDRLRVALGLATPAGE
jgi:circadian clock protein KaiB